MFDVIASLSPYLFIVSVAGAVIFYLRAQHRLSSIEQKVRELPEDAKHVREQEYLDWIELGGTNKVSAVDVGKESIKDYVVCRQVDQVAPSTPLRDLSEKLYSSEFKLLVVNNGAVVGTISRSDIGKALRLAASAHQSVAEMLDTTKASDIAQKDYRFAKTTQSVHDVVQLMNETRKIALIVLDDERRPFGIVVRTQLAARVRRRLLETQDKMALSTA